MEEQNPEQPQKPQLPPLDQLKNATFQPNLITISIIRELATQLDALKGRTNETTTAP